MVQTRATPCAPLRPHVENPIRPLLNFSQLIIKVNVHRLLAEYQKYLDKFFLDTIKDKILKTKL